MLLDGNGITRRSRSAFHTQRRKNKCELVNLIFDETACVQPFQYVSAILSNQDLVSRVHETGCGMRSHIDTPVVRGYQRNLFLDQKTRRRYADSRLTTSEGRIVYAPEAAPSSVNDYRITGLNLEFLALQRLFKINVGDLVAFLQVSFTFECGNVEQNTTSEEDTYVLHTELSKTFIGNKLFAVVSVVESISDADMA